MKFKKQEDLKCIYCKESQELPAIDTIPFIPNFNGYAKPAYDTSVHSCQCSSCDEFFYVKLAGDIVLADNLPSKLYKD